MKKLFKILLAFVFLTTAFFTTGCNNNDDYDYWKSTKEINSLLLRIGVPSIAVNNRAVDSNKTITFGGVALTYVNSNGGFDFYSGYIDKAIINSNTASFILQIDNNVFYIEGDFFRAAFSGAASGSQPHALLTFDQIFNILTAENNGVSVAAPKIWTDNPEPQPTEEGTATLSRSGDTILAVVPSELGNVTSLYSWEIGLSTTSGNSSRILYSGQYPDMYSISQDGNNFYFTITEKGKSNLKSNTTYVANLISAVIYTDKFGNQPIKITSLNTVYYNK